MKMLMCSRPWCGRDWGSCWAGPMRDRRYTDWDFETLFISILVYRSLRRRPFSYISHKTFSETWTKASHQTLLPTDMHVPTIPGSYFSLWLTWKPMRATTQPGFCIFAVIMSVKFLLLLKASRYTIQARVSHPKVQVYTIIRPMH